MSYVVGLLFLTGSAFVTWRAAKGRSRARWTAAAVVLLMLSPGVAWLLVRAGLLPSGAVLICGFILGGPVGLFLLPELDKEARLVSCSMSTVTARTLTGERTVDLRHISRVRLRTGFSYGRAFHTPVVRDRDGVRLALTSERSRRSLARALQRIPAGAEGAPVVSAAARAALDIGPRGPLTAHTAGSLLLLILTITLYVVGVLRLAGV